MVGQLRKRRNEPAKPTKTKRVQVKRPKLKLDRPQRSEQSGVLLVTGGGDFGQLGLGPDVTEKLRPVRVKDVKDVVDICAGGMHTVCLTKDGKVITFGCNDEGALGRVTEGIEDAEFIPGEVELPGKALQISAGDSHTAVLLEDGRVFAWGTFRDSHGSMGLSLNGNEPKPYELFNDCVKIASGTDHIVLLNSQGDVYTCGCGEQGQLGRLTERSSNRNARHGPGKEQIAKLLVPTQVVLRPSLRLHFDDIWANAYGTFIKVAAKDDIYVFGLNNYYQLGLLKEVPQYSPKLSKELSKNQWRIISGGEHHTLAVDVNGKAYSLGCKEYGRLGLGDNLVNDVKTLTEVANLNDKNIVNAGCGSRTSFFVTDSGELYACGMGTGGQLGTGDEDDYNVPTLVKSKALTDCSVTKVSGGGQHTVIMAIDNNNNTNDKVKPEN